MFTAVGYALWNQTTQSSHHVPEQPIEDEELFDAFQNHAV
jgi:hypothetical protein